MGRGVVSHLAVLNQIKFNMNVLHKLFAKFFHTCHDDSSIDLCIALLSCSYLCSELQDQQKAKPVGFVFYCASRPFNMKCYVLLKQLKVKHHDNIVLFELLDEGK